MENKDLNSFFDKAREEVDEGKKGITIMTDYYITIRKQLIEDGNMDEDYVDDTAMELFKLILAMNRKPQGEDC